MRKRGTLFALSSLVVTTVHVLTVAGTSYADGPQPVPIAAPPPVPVGTAPATNAPATAQNGPDAVYLKDGGMIRGTIIEVLPGKTKGVRLAFMPVGVADCHHRFDLELGSSVELDGASVPLGQIDFETNTD